jgi:hypothetical protein
VAWQNLKRVQQIRRMRQDESSFGGAPAALPLAPAAPVVSAVVMPLPLQVGAP